MNPPERPPFMQFSLRSLLLAMFVISFYLALFTAALGSEPLGFQLQILGLPICYVCGFVAGYYFIHRRRKSREELAGSCLITLQTTWGKWSGLVAAFGIFLSFYTILKPLVHIYAINRVLISLGSGFLMPMSVGFKVQLYVIYVMGGIILACYWPLLSTQMGMKYCDLREQGVLRGIFLTRWKKVRGYEWSKKNGDHLHIKMRFMNKAKLIVPPESRERVEEILEEYGIQNLRDDG